MVYCSNLQSDHKVETAIISCYWCVLSLYLIKASFWPTMHESKQPSGGTIKAVPLEEHMRIIIM